MDQKFESGRAVHRNDFLMLKPAFFLYIMPGNRVLGRFSLPGKKLITPLYLEDTATGKKKQGAGFGHAVAAEIG